MQEIWYVALDLGLVKISFCDIFASAKEGHWTTDESLRTVLLKDDEQKVITAEDGLHFTYSISLHIL